MARRKKPAAKRRARRRGTQITYEGRRYKKGTRNLRAAHGGHAGQKGGWLGALFTGFKAIFPHLLSAGAQIGASAASSSIQGAQQEAMQKRAEQRARKMQMEQEQRQREMYGLDD